MSGRRVLQVEWLIVMAVGCGYAWSAEPAEPAIIQVAANGTGDFQTIQEAIDQARAGTIVRVGAGTWDEALTITKPLTLEGTGCDQTQIVSASDGKQQASRDLQRGLQQIYQELDAETRMKLTEAYQRVFGASPALTVTETEGVVIRGMSLLRSQPVREGSFSNDAAVEITDADVQLMDCAIIESPGTGIAVKGESHVKISDCLITNAWGKGITVATSENGSFEITDSDVRNNVYAGLSIGSKSPNVRVARCRIQGTGWHGIRYDNCSPVIEDNVFHRTAVSGIYASGKTAATIRGNLFYHSGISCWFQNADTIESNTFIGDRSSDQKGGISQGMQVLGASQPTIQKNLFVTCTNAIFLGDIGSDGPFSKSTCHVDLVENVFWDNERNLAGNDAETKQPQSLPLAAGNNRQQPEFTNPTDFDFSLKEDSPLSKAGIGAQRIALFKSPWPERSEEQRAKNAVDKRLVQTSAQR